MAGGPTAVADAHDLVGQGQYEREAVRIVQKPGDPLPLAALPAAVVGVRFGEQLGGKGLGSGHQLNIVGVSANVQRIHDTCIVARRLAGVLRRSVRSGGGSLQWQVQPVIAPATV